MSCTVLQEEYQCNLITQNLTGIFFLKTMPQYHSFLYPLMSWVVLRKQYEHTIRITLKFDWNLLFFPFHYINTTFSWVLRKKDHDYFSLFFINFKGRHLTDQSLQLLHIIYSLQNLESWVVLRKQYENTFRTTLKLIGTCFFSVPIH